MAGAPACKGRARAAFSQVRPPILAYLCMRRVRRYADDEVSEASSSCRFTVNAGRLMDSAELAPLVRNGNTDWPERTMARQPAGCRLGLGSVQCPDRCARSKLRERAVPIAVPATGSCGAESTALSLVCL